MVSPEFKRLAPPLVVITGIAVGMAAILSTVAYIKNSLASVDSTSASTFPFPSRSSVIITPAPIETPSDIATTPATVESSVTPSMTPSPSATPTKSELPTPSPSPTHASASPTMRPLDVKVFASHYITTGAHSGLAYIDSEMQGSSGKRSHSSEFKLQCGTYVVKIGVVSYTDGDLDFQQKPTQYPELTTVVCEGNQVTPDLINDPSKYAGYLLPLAKIA